MTSPHEKHKFGIIRSKVTLRSAQYSASYDGHPEAVCCDLFTWQCVFCLLHTCQV